MVKNSKNEELFAIFGAYQAVLRAHLHKPVFGDLKKTKITPMSVRKELTALLRCKADIFTRMRASS